MRRTIVSDQLDSLQVTPLASDRWARKLVHMLLAKIRRGKIVIKDGLGEQSFGNDQDLCARVQILDHGVYKRVLFGGSIGAGEAYIDNQWEADDLSQLLRIMALNISLVDRMEQGFAWLLRPLHLVRHLLRNNSKGQAKANILSHYDLGNEMYQTFLDPTMMYSSAMYPHEAAVLEEAATHKLEIICRKLALQPTDHVVEIGSGWGGFAIYAAQQYGCQVTTTTISDAQYREATRRVKAAGLEDKVTVLQKDYRELTGQYDKLVSIEMIEAVGHRYLPTFFRQCERLLKESGVMLLQAITIADQKYFQYARSVDFIQRHIFPGGCLPSLQRMQDILARKTDMVVRHLEDFGFDYARTLQDWHKRFLAASPKLKELGYDERFRRLWQFYLCYCEAGFWERTISVVHLMATRPQNRLSLKLEYTP